MRLPALTILAALATALPAAASTPITLDQAMANPDWIGNPVEAAWWSWDGKQAYYKQKRTGSPVRDTWAALPKPHLVADSELPRLDSQRLEFNRARSRAIVVRNGDLFERDLKNGALVQIIKSPAPVSSVQYSADENSVQFRIGDDWFSWSRAERLVSPVALPRAAKDPNAVDSDALRDMQLRLFTTLKRGKDERDELRANGDAQRAADPTRAPNPIYLGDKITLRGSALSPDGRWLLLVTGPKEADRGKTAKIDHFVTESGYEDFQDERTRVGRSSPSGQALKLVDLATNKVQDLSFDALPGIGDDPLAALRVQNKQPALKGSRPVRVVSEEGQGIQFAADGEHAAVMVRSVDNKDRWIATIDFGAAKLVPVHRLTDNAWVNYDNSEFGWLPDSRTLWFLSEESGYSHLYTLDSPFKQHAVTQGAWEASSVKWSADGSTAWFLCNRKQPGTYEVCTASAKGGDVREVTALDGGVENYAISPDQRKLLVRHSAAYLPAQLSIVPANGGAATRLTDTRTAEFKAREWIMPQFVAVPSTHGGEPVWAKMYRPAQLEPGKKYPIVMFVHGAGYLQEVDHRYTNYFREQMFNNLLVQSGFVVLDMDYRGSKGYGSKWRTAIYRNMGHPELDDYIDGVGYMVANAQGDATNVGVYGGSYGGFMSLMAMFRAPEVFKSGAALRPVTDWTTYNHGYTSNILNTPELDPEAYKTSSPIEYAENLRGNLLIAHGMIDDNVFFQDSVRLSQRLIELKKDNWSLAGYPMERHGFVHPESWYDEYRRIYQLFERTLKQ
ncbi:S9 family peptidase [Massilia terrae]|uniref:Prolyl oligopeptidase family serine peptidase n=1 Tax=Massilia terrae TaxID=1811224 RepID=A0ABT2CZP3_9BURK|nr:prolyl oligopeptidase family serine peptidase [Massilia terrae]MCS0659448.1 prolyl oligopeptidase family serine peptidase [Massilia terrae]